MHVSYYRRGTGATSFAVLAGDHYLNGLEGTEQNIPVAQKYEHPNYDNARIDNDITLLKLASTLTLNEYVKPVCIKSETVPIGTDCITSGWGATGKH